MVYAVIVGGGVNNECGDEKGWFRALIGGAFLSHQSCRRGNCC